MLLERLRQPLTENINAASADSSSIFIRYEAAPSENIQGNRRPPKMLMLYNRGKRLELLTV